jgi:hypothetical protein
MMIVVPPVMPDVDVETQAGWMMPGTVIDVCYDCESSVWVSPAAMQHLLDTDGAWLSCLTCAARTIANHEAKGEHVEMSSVPETEPVDPADIAAVRTRLRQLVDEIHQTRREQ